MFQKRQRTYNVLTKRFKCLDFDLALPKMRLTGLSTFWYSLDQKPKDKTAGRNNMMCYSKPFCVKTMHVLTKWLHLEKKPHYQLYYPNISSSRSAMPANLASSIMLTTKDPTPEEWKMCWSKHSKLCLTRLAVANSVVEKLLMFVIAKSLNPLDISKKH